MTGDNQRYALQLRRDAVEKFVVKLLDGLHDGRTGLIIQPDQVWKTRRSWVGDSEHMQKSLSARIGERYVVPFKIDLPIPSPDTTYNAYIESGQQKMWCFEASCCIMVARDNDRRHGRPRAVKSLDCLVEKPLRLSGWILAVEDITSHVQNVYLSLSHNAYHLSKYLGMLIFARVSTQGLPSVPTSMRQHPRP